MFKNIYKLVKNEKQKYHNFNANDLNREHFLSNLKYIVLIKICIYV